MLLVQNQVADVKLTDMLEKQFKNRCILSARGKEIPGTWPTLKLSHHAQHSAHTVRVASSQVLCVV